MFDPKLRAAVDEATKHLIADGKLIEAGFQSLLMVAYPGRALMPPDQYHMLRAAFFAGAQHLMGSMMSALDPEAEPTEADLDRMGKIMAELDAFIEQYARDHIKTRGSA
jgi:hypothetical protein